MPRRVLQRSSSRLLAVSEKVAIPSRAVLLSRLVSTTCLPFLPVLRARRR
jgi:hypothetical protein